jgi:lysophospholipase L1-like esterase
VSVLRRLRRPVSRRGTLLAAAVTATGGLVGSGAAAASTASPDGIFLLGDSWAAGLHADPERALGQVAAEALGRPITVDAVSGTGYLNEAGDRTYLERARAAGGPQRLVIVQGGSNDDAEDLHELGPAVAATLAALRRSFPAARLLVLGPGPDPEPVTAVQRAVDAVIRDTARSVGVAAVSMLEEGWIPPGRADAVIDPRTAHPSPAGHRYLGLRLAAAVQLLVPDVLGPR